MADAPQVPLAEVVGAVREYVGRFRTAFRDGKHTIERAVEARSTGQCRRCAIYMDQMAIAGRLGLIREPQATGAVS